MYGIPYTYIWLICMVNVGKYTSPMDPMGKFVWLRKPFKKGPRCDAQCKLKIRRWPNCWYRQELILMSGMPRAFVYLGQQSKQKPTLRQTNIAMEHPPFFSYGFLLNIIKMGGFSIAMLVCWSVVQLQSQGMTEGWLGILGNATKHASTDEKYGVVSIMWAPKTIVWK